MYKFEMQNKKYFIFDIDFIIYYKKTMQFNHTYRLLKTNDKYIKNSEHFDEEINL